MQIDYRDLLECIKDGVYFTDTDRRIIYWNDSAERITGYTAREIIGKRCLDDILVHVDEQGRSLCRSMCPLAATMHDGTPREAKVFLHHREGHRVPVYVRVTPLHDSKGKLIGGAEFFTDISSQETVMERLRELERIALLDPLTGLPNRHHLLPELNSRFYDRQRLKLGFGLIFVDVDKFKGINDSIGHHAGDLVLKTVANTMKASVRPFDLVGRWGGDEFVCIVRNADEQIIRTISQRLLAMINTSSVQSDGRRIGIAVSIGSTLALDEDTEESLVQRVDALMYRSKQDGGNRITFG